MPLTFAPIYPENDTVIVVALHQPHRGNYTPDFVALSNDKPLVVMTGKTDGIDDSQNPGIDDNQNLWHSTNENLWHSTNK